MHVHKVIMCLLQSMNFPYANIQGLFNLLWSMNHDTAWGCYPFYCIPSAPSHLSASYSHPQTTYSVSIIVHNLIPLLNDSHLIFTNSNFNFVLSFFHLPLPPSHFYVFELFVCVCVSYVPPGCEKERINLNGCAWKPIELAILYRPTT